MTKDTSGRPPAGKNLRDPRRILTAADPTGLPEDALPPCGDFDIRIAHDGSWYYRGTPIGRKRLVKLFATVLHRDTEGQHWLITPAERGRVEVEDVAFTAVEVRAEGSGEAQVLRFRTNVGDWVEADHAHPLRLRRRPGHGEQCPYILVRGRLEARLLRPVFYHLVELGVESEAEGQKRFGVWSRGTFFSLGTPV